MNLHHILAAADESEAVHQAVRSAIDLAARAHASVTVMRTFPVGAMAVAAGATEASDFDGIVKERPSLQDLHQWVRTELHAQRRLRGRRQIPVAGSLRDERPARLLGTYDDITRKIVCLTSPHRNFVPPPQS